MKIMNCLFVLIGVGALLFSLPFVWLSCQLTYLSSMSADETVLESGHNAIFLTLAKGRYIMKVTVSDKSADGSNFSINGRIMTNSSTNDLSMQSFRSEGGGVYWGPTIQCEEFGEHVSIVLDVVNESRETNKISAVVFPIK